MDDLCRPSDAEKHTLHCLLPYTVRATDPHSRFFCVCSQTQAFENPTRLHLWLGAPCATRISSLSRTTHAYMRTLDVTTVRFLPNIINIHCYRGRTGGVTYLLKLKYTYVLTRDFGQCLFPLYDRTFGVTHLLKIPYTYLRSHYYSLPTFII